MKKKFISFFLLAAGWLLASYAQQAKVSLPQTKAGKRVEAFIKAFNAGETAMREFFIQHTAKDALQNIPLEVRLSRYRQMRDRLGSLELRQVIESGDNFVSTIVHGSSGQFVKLEFQFEPAEPFCFISIGVEDIEGEEVQANPKKDNSELVEAISFRA